MPCPAIFRGFSRLLPLSVAGEGEGGLRLKTPATATILPPSIPAWFHVFSPEPGIFLWGLSVIESNATLSEFAEAPPSAEILDRIHVARARLGSRLLILGHHYQRDEVIQFADRTGDSFDLSRFASSISEAEYVVFCGVHFMAETADILTSPEQKVILPDMKAGCSMADMADIDQVELCWEELTRHTSEVIIPVTYMNSAASLKAFCGRHGGTVCTSSNAQATFKWAWARGQKVLFFPDQHLGRNTAHALGTPLADMIMWDPTLARGGNTEDELKAAKVILWRGHCSVHQHFQPSHPGFWRKQIPGIRIIVHPECRFEVVQQADVVGSTNFIIKAIDSSAPGSAWAVGTEHHLVNRLKNRHPDKFITTLAPFACQCSTMTRIDPIDLMEILEGLVEGRVVNQIVVDREDAHWARIALDRMLSIV